MINVDQLDDQVKLAVNDAKKYNDNNNETQLIRDAINNLNTHGLDEKNEISALAFNDSQFNQNDDSQMKDLVEESVFTKPSMIGRFLDNDSSNDNEIAKRFRRTGYEEKKLIQENKNRIIDQKNQENDGNKMMLKEPQFFPGLDTSGIDQDITHHHYDKEFGANDGSFVGMNEQNNFGAEEEGNMFSKKPSKYCQDGSNFPIIPSIGTTPVT